VQRLPKPFPFPTMATADSHNSVGCNEQRAVDKDKSFQEEEPEESGAGQASLQKEALRQTQLNCASL
jgi:hypothetical protein